MLLIGTDAPGVDRHYLRAAATALARHDAVVGPALDGGYTLIGLRRPAPQLFDAMPWSTSQVMDQTRTRLRRLGLRHAELAPLSDIDEPADLASPAARLARLSSAIGRRRMPAFPAQGSATQTGVPPMLAIIGGTGIYDLPGMQIDADADRHDAVRRPVGRAAARSHRRAAAAVSRPPRRRPPAAAARGQLPRQHLRAQARRCDPDPRLLGRRQPGRGDRARPLRDSEPVFRLDPRAARVQLLRRRRGSSRLDRTPGQRQPGRLGRRAGGGAAAIGCTATSPTPASRGRAWAPGPRACSCARSAVSWSA